MDRNLEEIREVGHCDVYTQIPQNPAGSTLHVSICGLWGWLYVCTVLLVWLYIQYKCLG